MNKTNTQVHLSKGHLPGLSAIITFIAGLLLTGCQVGTPIVSPATQTLLPTPQAESTGETGALPTAYPPPASTYPDSTGQPVGSIPNAPPPVVTLETAGAYPVPASVFTPPSEIAGEATPGSVFFPMIGEGPTVTVAPTELPTAAATEPPTLTPSPTTATAIGALPTPIHVVDFAAARQELAAQGQQLAYNKVGFHVTFLEDRDELDPYIERLDSEGVPFFLKSVDNAEPLYKAQELIKASGVPHTLVYRSTKYDVPNYDLDPIQAAETYWELEKAIWPPELDPALVWFETMNELDKNRSEWLAQFSLRTAQLALRDGYKWAAFGWASGEPEPSDWESPAMLELLRLIGENPDRLAIALHEYSYVAADIGDDYPHKIGRFLDLFRVADENNIPRPTVLITEWGWTYNNIPAEPDAMEDITWAARLYGAYPEVKGAALWNLGKLDDTLLPLNTQVGDLIDNLLALSLDSTFAAPALPSHAPPDAAQFPPPQ